MKNELLAPNGKPSNLNATQYELVRTPAFKKWFGDWENDPANSSKVIDENREPLVVYHGSKTKFNIFDIEKISENTGNFGHYGFGFYFSEDYSESKFYGDIVIDVFLNIRKPFTSTFNEYLKLKELGYEVPDVEDKKIKIQSLLNNYVKDEKTSKFINDFKQNGYEFAWDNLLENENTKEEKNFYNDLNTVLEYTEYGKEEGLYDYIYELLDNNNINAEFIKGFEYEPSLHYVLDVGNLSLSFTKDIKELGYDGVIYGSEYVCFSSNQIKLADGTNISFDENNPDIRFEQGGEIDNFKDFYNELKIEDGSKYIGQKFGNVFPFLGKKNRFVPNDFRIMVKQYNGVLSRLEKNEYSSKSIKQRDLNKLERIKKYIDKKEFLGNFYLDSTGTIVDFKSNEFEKGGRTIAQTPAPKEDRVYGSDINKKSSSKDLSSAKLIKFDDNTLDVIKNKVKEHNEEYPDKKINLSSAKAVVRRGMGAYSKSHRPTISGGKPNSRVAWGLARLNAFTYKIVNGKSKSGKYTQDDDLIEELGFEVANYQNGGEMKKDIRCINCGWEWNKKDSELWDMYICHKCGFDNTTFYTSIPIKNYSKGGQTEKTNPNYLKMFLGK